MGMDRKRGEEKKPFSPRWHAFVKAKLLWSRCDWRCRRHWDACRASGSCLDLARGGRSAHRREGRRPVATLMSVTLSTDHRARWAPGCAARSNPWSRAPSQCWF